ncbi:MAG TPA: CoA pyrophosphatase [Azospira sp.]|nr:CoA pyrophosphatase [Azospira sp.]
MSGGFDLDSLRSSLAQQPGASAAVLEDGLGDERLTPAAVLVPIVRHASAPTLLLTQRTAHLRDHAGQISFPGGRIEPDDPSIVHAALREAEEEVGLAASHVEVVGYLPDYRTSTGFSVTPVVAFVTPPFALRPDPFEVAEVFEVPLAFLLDPANHQQHEVHWRGRLRQYYAMPYGDYFIWGATAGMIMSLYRHLAQPSHA